MDKQKLIELATELLNEENLSSRSEDLNYLRREYKYLADRDEDSFYEKEQNDKFLALYNKLAEKEPKLTLSPLDEKKQIIASIKELANKEDLVKASKEVERLSGDFKKAGRCSKEQDDILWEEFRQAKDEFYNKKREYFAKLDALNAEKKVKKEEIIAKAKEVCEVKNIRDANAQMDALMKEWKQVGYSGKEDNELWKQFSEVLDTFRIKRKEYHQEMIKTFEERANKKEELIKTMKKLLANSEFTEEEVKKVKDLRAEFKNVGFAGKEKDDDLYKRFDEVVQKYFEEKKFYTL